MNPSTRTPEGQPHRCPLCGKRVMIEPSKPAKDAPCPHCGSLLWFADIAGHHEVYGFHRFSISDPLICTKAQALAAIVDRLVKAGALSKEHQQGVLAATLKREELGSTGIGGGVAINHAKFPGVGSVLGALASFPAGVDFDSLDGERVQHVCLFVSPTYRPAEHLGLLEAVARRLRERS